MRKAYFFSSAVCLVLVACSTPEKALDQTSINGSDSLTVETKDSLKKKDVRGEQIFAPKGTTLAPKSKKENL